MIFENIKFHKDYSSANKYLNRGIQFLLETDLKALDVGRHEIDGDHVYALVQEYETEPREARRFEAHKKYIDIQYIQSGAEIIDYAPVEGLDLKEDKFDEKDAGYYKKPKDYQQVILHVGDYGIFFPEEAHRPCCMIEEPMTVRKIVVKVRIK